MVVWGVIDLESAKSAVDLDTILFLLGMMVVLAYLELSGFFEMVERQVLGFATSARSLLWFVIGSAGLLSALFMNDTVCLMLTPVIVRVTRRLELPPAPYLVALATAANIGSSATMSPWKPHRLRTVRSHDEFDVAIEHVKQIKHLINRFLVVGLIEDPIELGRGGAEPTNDLTFRQRAHFDPPLCLERQPVEKKITQVAGILVVLENLLDVNRPLPAGFERVNKPLPFQLFIYHDASDTVGGARLWIGLGVREGVDLRMRPDLECLLAVIELYTSDLHKRPSDSSSSISSRIRCPGPTSPRAFRRGRREHGAEGDRPPRLERCSHHGGSSPRRDVTSNGNGCQGPERHDDKDVYHERGINLRHGYLTEYFERAFRPTPIHDLCRAELEYGRGVIVDGSRTLDGKR
jgi:hypothetical protein